MYDIAMTMRFSPHLEYDDEQGAFHTDMLRDDAGCWIRAADYDAVKVERDRLVAALRGEVRRLRAVIRRIGTIAHLGPRRNDWRRLTAILFATNAALKPKRRETRKGEKS